MKSSREYGLRINGRVGSGTYSSPQSANDAIASMRKEGRLAAGAKVEVVSRPAYAGQSGPPPPWK